MEEYKKPTIISVSLITIFFISFVVYLYVSSNNEQILDDQGVVTDEVLIEKQTTEDKERESIINELLKDDTTNVSDREDEIEMEEVINKLITPTSPQKEADIEKEMESVIDSLLR